MFRNILYIGIGGGTGAILRYLTGLLALRALPESRLPVGTFAVNILGCFFIGLAYAVMEKNGTAHPIRLLIITGVLGGFTTFSSFGNETFALLRSGNTVTGAGYALLSIILGLAAVWLGIICAGTTQG